MLFFTLKDVVSKALESETKLGTVRTSYPFTLRMLLWTQSLLQCIAMPFLCVTSSALRLKALGPKAGMRCAESCLSGMCCTEHVTWNHRATSHVWHTRTKSEVSWPKQHKATMICPEKLTRSMFGGRSGLDLTTALLETISAQSG